ncbi:MAG TPA: tetratricopeptide repeat protein [Pyrinomonadaceae bacterium]|nr:tetratricopeptide repeat protein [Pyrinomonadaceae bacterium]
MQAFFRFPLTAIIFLSMGLTTLAQRDRDTYSNASANAVEVVGQVRLVETGLPANRISVRLERFGGGLIDQMETDSGGRFRFANLARGYYKIVVNAPGFRATQQDADLQVVYRAYLVFELTSEKAGAMTLIDVVDARAPAGAREALVRGREALSKKSYPEAIEQLQKAITSYPAFYEAHLLLGTAFVDQREWRKAEVAFQAALELKASSATAKLALGEVYWRQHRLDEAEKTLLEGLKLDEKSWHGYFTLARLYWDQENIAKAAPAIGHTLQLKPDFAEAHLLAGNVLLKVNQQQRAAAEYQEYLRLEPKGEFAVQARELIEKLNKASGENKKSSQ